MSTSVSLTFSASNTRDSGRSGRGHPCAINNLALHALIGAYAGKKAIVDESSVRDAITEVASE